MNFPALVKVNEYVCVGASTGDVKPAWVEAMRRLRVSAFVHVTVSPSETVSAFGVKPAAVIETWCVAAVEPGTSATAAATMLSRTIFFML